MKKRFWVFGILVVVLALATLLFFGCGGSSSDGSSGSEGGQEVPDDGEEEVEYINGVEVPPEPDAEEDASTVGGVDSNGNIARDVVERMIAEEWGGTEFYDEALEYAIAEQAALNDPSEENVETFIYLLGCSDNEVLDNLSAITDATIDTGLRKKAYARAFAGVLMSGC